MDRLGLRALRATPCRAPRSWVAGRDAVNGGLRLTLQVTDDERNGRAAYLEPLTCELRLQGRAVSS
eukprot:15438106-Alexandrium_andersonii.AAC.1